MLLVDTDNIITEKDFPTHPLRKYFVLDPFLGPLNIECKLERRLLMPFAFVKLCA